MLHIESATLHSKGNWHVSLEFYLLIPSAEKRGCFISVSLIEISGLFLLVGTPLWIVMALNTQNYFKWNFSISCSHHCTTYRLVPSIYGTCVCLLEQFPTAFAGQHSQELKGYFRRSNRALVKSAAFVFTCSSAGVLVMDLLELCFMSSGALLRSSWALFSAGYGAVVEMISTSEHHF